MFAERQSFRLAAAASVGLHVLLLVGVLAIGRKAGRESANPQAVLDTRLKSETRITMAFADAEIAVPVPVPSPPVREAVPAVPQTPPEPAPDSAMGSRPEAHQPPRTLPAGVLALIRKTPLFTPAEIQPVAVVPAAPQLLDGGQPMHGTLARGQTVVYVLDASGSMGAGGRFDRARRALLATLRQQPGDVRFQVIVYAGTARTLLPVTGGCVPATAENIERTAIQLMAVEPVGRSSHAEGLRLAGTLNPEFVVVLTDADDLPADAIRTLTARLARSPVVSIVVVGSESVEPPRPWRERRIAP